MSELKRRSSLEWATIVLERAVFVRRDPLRLLVTKISREAITWDQKNYWWKRFWTILWNVWMRSSMKDWRLSRRILKLFWTRIDQLFTTAIICFFRSLWIVHVSFESTLMWSKKNSDLWYRWEMIWCRRKSDQQIYDQFVKSLLTDNWRLWDASKLNSS
jgi:hypothetical protein